MAALTKQQRMEILGRMLRNRLFEEKAIELFDAGEIPGSAHLSIGQEACTVGACFALHTDDYMVGTHRSHGHSVANNADVRGLMAELLGRTTGVNRGKGGSMHLADKKVGSLGETSIVGSGSPVACGAALASKIRKDGRVTLVFYGDGAANEGAVHEAMNLAATWKLPVIFVLENNGVAVSSLTQNTSNVEDLYLRAAGYGMPGEKVDGQDAEAVYEAVNRAAELARCGGGPSLVELKTYRFREHSEGRLFRALVNHNYRDQAQHEKWLNERDPIKLYSQKLIKEGIITEEEYENIRRAEADRIEDSVRFAKESPFPDPGEAYTGVFSTPVAQ